MSTKDIKENEMKKNLVVGAKKVVNTSGRFKSEWNLEKIQFQNGVLSNFSLKIFNFASKN